MNDDDQYFIELAAKPQRFERVNRFVWDNRSKAVDDNGEPRYSNNRFCIVNGKLDISMFDINPSIFGRIVRMCGIDIDQSRSPQGFYDEPTHVPIKRGKICLLHDLQSGAVYRKVA